MFSKLGKLFSILKNSRAREEEVRSYFSSRLFCCCYLLEKKEILVKVRCCTECVVHSVGKTKTLGKFFIGDWWNCTLEPIILSRSFQIICTDFFFSLFKYFSIQWFVEESYEKYSNVYLKIPFWELNKGCCPMTFIYENISNNKAYFFNPLLYKTKTHGNQWSYCALHNIWAQDLIFWVICHKSRQYSRSNYAYLKYHYFPHVLKDHSHCVQI